MKRHLRIIADEQSEYSLICETCGIEGQGQRIFMVNGFFLCKGCAHKEEVRPLGRLRLLKNKIASGQ